MNKKYAFLIIGIVTLMVGIYFLVIGSLSSEKGFLIYSDYLMNYSINYPDDLQITREEPETPTSNLQSNNFTVFRTGNGDMLFSIGVWKNSNHINAQDDLKMISDCNNCIYEYQIDKIGDLEELEIDQSEPFERRTIQYYTNDSIYVLNYYGEKDETYKNIINSFRLIIK